MALFFVSEVVLFPAAKIYEYAQVGDAPGLRVIILDGGVCGVQDSVVNQMVAKKDGAKEANNDLVLGLTNRPELLDPVLL